MTATAKVFKNGASQAVRLPKEFRFDVDEVCVKRIGSAVLLFPKAAAWDLMGEAIAQAGEDFPAERNQPRRAERRKPLEAGKGGRPELVWLGDTVRLDAVDAYRLASWRLCRKGGRWQAQRVSAQELARAH